MLVSQSKQIIYVPVERTASRTIEQVLVRSCGDLAYLPDLPYRHVLPNSIDDSIKNYTLIIGIRHPFERMVSFYNQQMAMSSDFSFKGIFFNDFDEFLQMQIEIAGLQRLKAGVMENIISPPNVFYKNQLVRKIDSVSSLVNELQVLVGKAPDIFIKHENLISDLTALNVFDGGEIPVVGETTNNASELWTAEREAAVDLIWANDKQYGSYVSYGA